jgi:4,5-dihydroxyphthalate decarboxylase
MTSAAARRNVMAQTTTKLRTALGTYPHTAKLKSGELKADGIELEFEEVKPVNRIFKPMAQDQKFDVSEMAIVTYLLARTYGKPIVLLPAVMFGRFQHNTLVYSAERGRLTPQDLPGKKIGVRSYTQTTGVWIRGIIENDYGVDLNKAQWTVQEGAHVAEYKDPPELNRISMEHDLLKMLLGREIDAVIYGADLPDDPRLKTVIENPKEEAAKWFKKHAVVPINHMVVVKKSLVEQQPEVVRQVYDLLRRGKTATMPSSDQLETTPFGIEATRPGLELIIDYAQQQKIIPRRYSVDEIYEDAVRIIGG